MAQTQELPESPAAELGGGALPPASALKAYEKVVPGSAKIVFAKFEKLADHNMMIERRGQIFAFLISIFAIAAGAYTATHGSEWSGAAIGSGGVIALALVFIGGRKYALRRREQR